MTTSTDLVDQLGEQVLGVQGAAKTLELALEWHQREGGDLVACDLAVFARGLEGIYADLQATFEALKEREDGNGLKVVDTVS